MENFIQKMLSCANIQESDNIIQSFPVLSVHYQNEERRILLFRFVNNHIPNYIVLGLFKKDFVLEKSTFLSWLHLLYRLIMCRPNQKNEHQTMMEQFKMSFYFDNLLYSQEGFDLINGKQYFTNGGLISRTIFIACHVYEDRTIEFANDVQVSFAHQFLEGAFFRNYDDFDQNYFLNYQEYHTMFYQKVLEYVEFNRERLAKKGNCDSRDIHYLVQVLDSCVVQEMFLESQNLTK